MQLRNRTDARTHLVHHQLRQHDSSGLVVGLILQQRCGVRLALLHLAVGQRQARQRVPRLPVLWLVHQAGAVRLLSLTVRSRCSSSTVSCCACAQLPA